ncbi:MAG: hypothetical protein GW859_00345 [Sphingomonadales bacterium]|nr:hypothetical protein [Sphingomonadales bacterium]
MSTPKKTAAEPKVETSAPAKVEAVPTAAPQVAGETETINQTFVIDNTEAERPEPKKASETAEESANGTVIVSYT